MARKRKALHTKRCITPRGQLPHGDARYAYKAWWCMTPAERAAATQRYPYSTPGIPDSAFAYPITKDGKHPKTRAHRALLWNYAHTVKKVGKHRARTLSGRRGRR